VIVPAFSTSLHKECGGDDKVSNFPLVAVRPGGAFFGATKTALEFSRTNRATIDPPLADFIDLSGDAHPRDGRRRLRFF
jgi:hypothetical protein